MTSDGLRLPTLAVIVLPARRLGWKPNKSSNRLECWVWQPKLRAMVDVRLGLNHPHKILKAV